MTHETKEEWAHRCAMNPGAEWRIQARAGERRIEHANEGTFDELVVDHWLHLEQLDRQTWWMRVGDARLQVAISADGAVTLDVQRGYYDDILGKTETVSADE